MNEKIINSIKEVVKTNGTQEITGAALQTVLVEMVRALGEYPTFAGMATPSTTPTTSDANVFFLAYEAGQYSGFGVTLDGETYNIIRRTSQGWEVLNTNIKTEEAIGENIAQSVEGVNDGIIDDELVVAAALNDLNDRVKALPTKKNVREAISSALADYSTTEEMDEAISEALKGIDLSNLTTYGGMATFSTTPPATYPTKLFYHANKKGEYPGFGVTLDQHGLYAISNAGGKWEATLLIAGEAPEDYSKEYFFVEALEDDITATFPVSVEYSTNKETWISLAANSPTPAISKGERIYFKATKTTETNPIIVSGMYNAAGNIMSLCNGDDFVAVSEITHYGLRKIFKDSHVVSAENLIFPSGKVTGNGLRDMFNGCTSLVKAPQLPAIEVQDHAYNSMFNGCTSLLEAPELPATNIRGNCYYRMFRGCTSLVKAPQLPATQMRESCYYEMFSGCISLKQAPALPAMNLANQCYFSMFRGCSSLEEAPELPATTLSQDCYAAMFINCTSLEKAPELPASVLENQCYDSMFAGCSQLSEITMLAVDVLSANRALNKWVYGVAVIGTFIQAAGVELPSGESGIPNNWTVEERAVA